MPATPDQPGFFVPGPEDASVAIEVTEIDRKRGILKGTDETGEKHQFYYMAKTRLKKIAPTETTTELGDLLKSAAPFPVDVDQEILVTWRLDQRTKAHIAIQLTVLR